MKTTQDLKELLYKNKTVADQQPDAIAEANAFCEGYKAFLNAAKTEREAAAYSEQLLKQAGYKPFVPGMALNAGDKVYLINRSKCVLAATIGERSMAEGFHLNIAHIDSPRLDLRPVPTTRIPSLPSLTCCPIWAANRTRKSCPMPSPPKT